MTKDELLDLVDENDEIIGSVWKSEAHGDPSKIHREVAIAVFNKKGEVLIQQRSMNKKIGPGEWKITAAGHVGKGEDPKKAAERELYEELGIYIKLNYFGKIFERDNKHNESKYYWIYYALIDEDITLNLNSEEVMDTRWIRPVDLEKSSQSNSWDTESASHKAIMELYNQKIKINET